MVRTTSRGRVPGVYVSGLATMRLITTELIRSSRTVSVEVVAYGTGVAASPFCSSVWLTTKRDGVSTSTVTCRRTSFASKVVSWCTRYELIGSGPTADSTASETSAG